MSGAPTPQALPSAFGIDAVNPTYINLIPATTATPGRASFDLGFPPLVMTPSIASGKPPFGQDMNGILYMLSTWTFYQQAGELPRFSSTVAAAISGYSLGTLLRSTDGSTLWFNIVDGNVTDPDGGSPAGWVSLESYGLANVTGIIGGVTTLTAAQAAKSFIVLSGALVGNSQVVLPNHVRSWLIVNNCTGAFTLTVKTAAGTGVVLPNAAGFSQPVGVYGDGTNIYPVLTPLSIPTDVAPTANTYPLRSNAGYIYATFFNMSGAADNLALDEIIYVAGGDGFLRRMSQANARVQLNASPTFTGIPAAPTAAPGTNTTQLATTAFVQAAAAGSTYGGYVDATGSGASILPPGWTVTHVGAGHYQINHLLGLTNIFGLAMTATLIIAATDDRWIFLNPLNGNTIDVHVADNGAGLQDNAFWFDAKRIAP
jgi:hypothetical protein